MAVRAVAKADKEARRRVILAAAHRLFRAGDGALPTSAEVASAAGLAKGTVYLYFKTKEEIFAKVLLEGWRPVLGFLCRPSTAEAVDQREVIESFQTFLMQHLENNPDLMRLDALSVAVLEQNMTAAALLEYKQQFDELLRHAGECLDKALHLRSGRGVEILLRTYALSRGLWQSVQHSPVRKPVAKGIKGKNMPEKEYPSELGSALVEYWIGALAVERDEREKVR